jgi:hypothetical protein
MHAFERVKAEKGVDLIMQTSVGQATVDIK